MDLNAFADQLVQAQHDPVKLVAALHAVGRSATGRDLADVLWLWLRIIERGGFPADPTTEPLQTLVTVPPSPPPAASSPTQLPQSSQQSQARPASDSSGVLYPSQSDGSKGSMETTAQVVRTPAVTPLPHALDIARALRPLRHRVSSRTNSSLDERATALRSAQERMVVPILRPAYERWLTIDLIVDQSRSMVIWQSTVLELRRLLMHQGAFRDVRLWSLDTEAVQPDLINQKADHDWHLPLYAGAHWRRVGPRRSVKELTDPSGRRLILLVSDCVSEGWQTGQVARELVHWARTNPITILQMLPKHAWDRTALGQELEVLIQSKHPGLLQTSLDVQDFSEWPEVERMSKDSLKVPVISLDPKLLNAWARCVAGAKDGWSPGYIFQTAGTLREPIGSSAPVPLSERVEQFFKNASPLARELVVLLSDTPVTLAVINLVRETFLPRADQTHVAEVLLSGLLYELPMPDGIDDPEEIVYEFYDGVRGLLRQRSSLSRTLSVIEVISRYLDEHQSRLRRMQALLKLPDTAVERAMRTQHRPFARIRAELLRSLGYSTLADLLEQGVGQPGGSVIAPEIRSQFQHGHALIIGVTHQPNLSQERPAITSSAIQAVAATLGDSHFCGYPTNQIYVYWGSAATRAHILAALDQLARVADEDDTVLIVHQGPWGVDDNGYDCLLAHDSSITKQQLILSGTAIRDHELLERVQQIRAKRVLIVLAGLPHNRIEQLPFALLGTGTGRIVIADRSTHEDIKALSSNLPSSFERNLVQSLRGQDVPAHAGYIVVDDLFAAMQRTSITSSLPGHELDLFVSMDTQPFAIGLHQGSSPDEGIAPAPWPRDRDGIHVIDPQVSEDVLRHVLAGETRTSSPGTDDVDVAGIEKTDHMFDVFISYSHADGAWVRDWLVPRLKAARLRVCVDSDLFDVGVPALVNMERAVASSRHTLLVLTPRWVVSQWSWFEALLVQYRNLTNLNEWLVPVLRERCDPPARIAMLTYADLRNIADLKVEWSKLLQALHGVRRLPESPAPKRLASLTQPRDSLHQIPGPLVDFVGRDEDIGALVRWLSRAAEGVAVRVSCIRGLGGVGKTQLAYVVAQQLAPAFPDAQLLLDLRGAGDTPLSPTQALQTIIRAFEPLAQLPAEQSQLEELYRSLLSGRRVLVLADDARDAAQVRPLLPPPGSALLVTSRQRFGLDGMQPLDLEMLSHNEAEALLLEICPRIGANAAELARLCGRLPLALRISASLLQNDATLSVERYLTRLSDERERLKHLRDPDDPGRDVDASLSLSYNALDPDAQDVLCQLSVFPAPFDRAAAEAVVLLRGQNQLTPDALEPLLSLLYRRSLLDIDPKSERYSLHDLVRLYGARRLRSVSTRVLRHAQHYAQIAASAEELYLQGGSNVLTGLELFDRERPQIDAGWLWAQRPASANSVAVDELLIEYADATVYIGDLRYDKRRERIPQFEAMLAAARRLERRDVQGVALGNLGRAYANLGEVHRATEYYEQQLVIAREIGDRRSEGNALGNLGLAYANLGEVRRSIEYCEQQLVIAREIGDRRGEEYALNNLGVAYANLGEVHRATEYYEQQLLIAREIGDRGGEGNALGNLGRAYANLGEVHRATEYYEQQLVIAREIGDRGGEAIACWNMGLALEQQGDLARAIELLQVLVDYEREIGHPDSEKNAAHIERLRQNSKQQ